MQHFVLVAGVDYGFRGVDFRRITDARRTLLEKRFGGSADLRFLTFDVRTGQVETYDVGYVSGRRVTSVNVETPFTPVTESSYALVGDHWRFRHDQHTIMSVTDVYRAVQQIGSQAPGTLHELSIVSHGWLGGPILVNSYDDRTMTVQAPPGGGPGSRTVDLIVPFPARDPDDKDGRAALDFRAPTMSPGQLTRFREAFAVDGRSWLWGCAWQRTAHELLVAVQRARGYRRAPMAADTELHLTGMRREVVDYLEELVEMAGGKAGPWPGNTPVKVPFQLLRYVVAAANASGYAVALADASQRTVHAAPFGTFADYDKGGRGLLHVPPGFAGHLAFYRHHLGVESDPEGRRYAVYEPGWIYPDLGI